MFHFTVRRALVCGVGCVIASIVVYNRGIDFGSLLQKGKDVMKSGQELYQKGKASYDQAATTVGAIVDVLSPSVKAIIKMQQPAITNNPYRDRVAQVSMGINLSGEERNYRSKRKIHVQGALENVLGYSLAGKYVPTIALVCSGGGYRAMLCTTGSLCGLDKIRLLDSVTYIAALSGSTWAVGSWFATGMPIADYRAYMRESITKKLQDVTLAEMKLITDSFLVKMAYDQPFTLVDLYGVLLGNRLLASQGNNRHMSYLSSQVERVRDGRWPYPIYTAVDGRQAAAFNPPWYEFTPYEVGCAAFQVYIPAWAYGRTFENGQSTNNAPEQSLGYHYGAWGSAFAAHAGLIWQELTAKITDPIVKPFIEKVFIEPMYGKRPLPFWSEMPNYMFGMANQELSDRELLKLVDAGLACNLPYPVISGDRPERMADIVIFLDASAGTLPSELVKVEKYARERKLPFPVINYTGITEKAISIFKDETNPLAPVVVYMPRISDPQLWQQHSSMPEYGGFALSGFDLSQCTDEGFCDTSNFYYSADNSKKVMNTTEFNMITSKNRLIEEINWVIATKSRN